jgi:hypothetical protein
MLSMTLGSCCLSGDMMLVDGEKLRALRGTMDRVVRLKMVLANIRRVRSRCKRNRDRE